MAADGGSPEDIGWQIDVDDEAAELRLEHPASGSVYRLDAEGGLRIPGEGPVDIEDAGRALQELQSTLAAALETEQQPTDTSTEAEDLQSSCRVECTPQGEVVLESPKKISLEAPVIDVSASGQLTATSAGILSLQGSIVKIN